MAESKQEKLKRARGQSSNSDGTKANSAGMKMLRKSAGNTVRQNSTKMTGRLLKEMLFGKLQCGKILMDLAEPQAVKEVAEKRPRGRTTAMMLADEPRWQEPETGLTDEPVGRGWEEED